MTYLNLLIYSSFIWFIVYLKFSMMQQIITVFSNALFLPLILWRKIPRYVAKNTATPCLQCRLLLEIRASNAPMKFVSGIYSENMGKLRVYKMSGFTRKCFALFNIFPNALWKTWSDKGQSISKSNYGVLNSSEKTKKNHYHS